MGDNIDAILTGVRLFPVKCIDLLYLKEFAQPARSLETRFASIKLDTRLHLIEGDPLIDTLRTVTAIVRAETGRFDEILVNVGGGPRLMTCAVLSAAFVNGLPSFDCREDVPVFLPVLKFSYAELVSDAKMAILDGIDKLGGKVDSLSTLAKVSGLEESLLSYHLRGGKESKGLEALGLVKIDRGTRGRLVVTLSPMAKLMLASRAPT